MVIVSFGGGWSTTPAAAAFGLYGLCLGVFAQLHRPTTPGSRRVFALLFVLVCVAILLTSAPEPLVIAIACVGGWTVGLGLAASFDPNDSASVKRSFSGQVIRRG